MARKYVRTSGKARKSLWVHQSFVNTTFTAVGGTIITTANAALLALRPFTIVRQYYELMLVSDQEAAVEKHGIAFGVEVVSDEAEAIGVTAVPTPETEAGSDFWMLHTYMFGEESRLTDKALPARHLKVESKAMRIVEGGSTWITVGEFVNVGGGSILSMAGRALIKVS